jgi:FKBP-type peptidyl-prolyl cis-trans isomerase
MKSKIYLSIISIAIIGLVACNKNGGIQKLSGGVTYQILKAGEGKDTGKVGDIITMHIMNATEKDSFVMDSHKGQHGKKAEPVKITLQAPAFKGDLMEGLLKLHVGDSAVFLVPSDSIFKNEAQRPPFIKKGSMVKTFVSVINIESKEKAQQRQADEAKAQIAKDDALIQSYIAAKGMKDVQKTMSGLYYVITKAGTGANVENGKTAVMNYTGRTLDGKMFDSNTEKEFNHEQPFKFKLGQGMVIRGWDEGVALLNKGAKATFIVPSTLGYGPQAIGDKIPANSVLTFDVELIGVE